MSKPLTTIISANDLHVLMTQFLTAATSIHTAMCVFPLDHAGQAHLDKAMQVAIIGADQCRLQLSRLKSTE